LFRVVGALVHYLPGRSSCQSGHRRLAIGDVPFLRQGSPWAVFFILSNAEGKLPGMPKRGAVDFTGDHSEQVDQRQADRATDRSIRSIAVSQDDSAGIHAVQHPDWTTNHNDRRCYTSACRGPSEAVFLVALRTEHD